MPTIHIWASLVTTAREAQRLTWSGRVIKNSTTKHEWSCEGDQEEGRERELKVSELSQTLDKAKLAED